MKQVLVCKNCGEAISHAVAIVEGNSGISRALTTYLPDPLVKAGECLRSDKSIIHTRYDFTKNRVQNSKENILGNWVAAAKIRLARFGFNDQQVMDLNLLAEFELALSGKLGSKWSPKAYLLHYAPQDWMNMDDLRNDLLDHNDEFLEEVESGYCCGPTGLFGPNFKCFCGIFVGTQCIECNIPEVFIPDPKETKWQNVKS